MVFDNVQRPMELEPAQRPCQNRQNLGVGAHLKKEEKKKRKNFAEQSDAFTALKEEEERVLQVFLTLFW